MRDTSDMTEDSLSEDTMMDCGGDGGGLEDFVELATDITDSSRTIRDAAERLLTLLGVEDDNEDFLSSSEDEGVEVDVDDEDEEVEELQNARLLHQLAASLAQELKYSQAQQNTMLTGATRICLQERVTFDERDQNVEMIQETNFLKESCLRDTEEEEEDEDEEEVALKNSMNEYHENQNSFEQQKYSFGYYSYETCEVDKESVADRQKDWNVMHLDDARLRTREDLENVQEGNSSLVLQRDQFSGSWGSGWDACAAEALRYLVEDEGLPPHHPTVVAMKNHLKVQRERVFTQQYAA